METVELISLTLGVGWAAGLNLYAAVLMLGLMGGTGYIDLPPGLEVLQNPLVLMGAGLMYFVEFFADKIPGVDTGWDAIHTFVRIPAGAALAAGALGPDSQALEFFAYLMGGGAAAASHFTKAGSRVLINASPEPLSNWTASVTEDVAVIGGLWAALNHPLWFLVFFVLFILLMIWLLPKIWRGIKALFGWLKRKLGGGDDTETTTPDPTPNNKD